MNSKVVTVRLPTEILSRLDAAGGNRSAIIIQALERFLTPIKERPQRELAENWKNSMPK